MSTLQKLLIGAALAGGLAFGVHSCKKNIEKKQEQRTEQRMDLYEEVLDYYEDTDTTVNKAELGEILQNCLQDMQQIDTFHSNYVAAEREYMSFIKIASLFSETAADPSGDMQAAIQYLGQFNRYMEGMDARKKKPIDMYKQITEVYEDNFDENQESLESLSEFTVKKTGEYRAFFDAVEETVNADVTFLDNILAYAAKRTDRDAGYAKRIASAVKKKRQSILSRVDYYQEMLERNAGMLEEYFPQKTEPEEKTKFISREF